MIVVSDGREIMQDGGIKIWRAKDPGRRMRGDLATSRRRRVTVGTIKNDPATDLRELRQVVVRFGQRRPVVWMGDADEPTVQVEEKAGYRYVESAEMVRAKAANGVPFAGLIVAGKELERKHGWWYADALVKIKETSWTTRDVYWSLNNGDRWETFIEDRWEQDRQERHPFGVMITPMVSPELAGALRAALHRYPAERRADWNYVPTGVYRLAGGRLWPQKGRWE